MVLHCKAFLKHKNAKKTHIRLTGSHFQPPRVYRRIVDRKFKKMRKQQDLDIDLLRDSDAE